MADIERKSPRELMLKKAENRTAELNFAITKLEVRKMEMAYELSNMDETIAATKKTLEEHLESSKNI